MEKSLQVLRTTPSTDEDSPRMSNTQIRKYSNLLQNMTNNQSEC